ncbi:sensor histidine kinase [Brevundimonas sp.]|uniref:sensor histidine kinase n=1 Tax=Brevundimonas sp. TaxID=1871086 RepID=UPI002FDA2A45
MPYDALDTGPDRLLTSDAAPRRFGTLDRDVLVLTALLWSAHSAHVIARSFILDWTNDLGTTLARCCTWATGFVVCLGVWALTRRMRRPGGFIGYFLRVAGLALIACAVITLCNETYFYWLSPLYVIEDRYLKPSELAVTYLGFLWILMTWAGFVGVVAGADDIRIRDRQVAVARTLAQQAQLTALRNQLQPHFLFNALNAVSSLVHDRDFERAERTLMQLSGFLGRVIDVSPHEMAPLREELEIERLFLGVEQVRFPDRLKVRYEIEEAALDSQTPRLILQPLIENAIKHGLARSVDPVTVTIGARRETDGLHIWVQDDAKPMRRSTSGLRVGLANTRERLAILYGEAARLVAAPLKPGWRSEIILPAA